MLEHQGTDLMQGWSTAMAGDFASLRGICADDCQIWHSSDDKWMPHKDALDGFIAAHEAGGIPDFEDVRIMPTATGFLCQARMTLAPIGTLHVLQLVTAGGGVITRIEEYIAPEMDLAAQLRPDRSGLDQLSASATVVARVHFSTCSSE